MKESLHIHLDFRSGIPIYIQVMNLAIGNGALRE